METLLFASQALADSGDAASLVSSLVTKVDPATTSVWMPSILEFIAVIAGAVSGALTACEKRLDIVGVCVLALITSLGGGLIRDMALQTHSVYMLDNPGVVVACLVTGLVTFFFSGLLYKMNKAVTLFDIISVALFTYSGADKALLAGFGPIPCILMGVLTGVGGGMIRDMCLGRIPNIFKSSNFYAVCSTAGAIVYITMVNLHVVKWVASLTCIAVVLTLRYLSLHYHLITAMPIDLTPEIVKPLRRFSRNHATDEAAPGDASHTPSPSKRKFPYHILVQRGEPMENWDDTSEQRELEERKTRELREND